MPSLGLGLGTNRINPLFRGLLNQYSGAAAAYSLEKLSSGTNNVVRVRRSSDDAESDFTAQQVSDGTLTTWTGANDGFVVTWYDQSGNSNDATQATAASQPKIVSAGALVTDAGDNAMQFDGTDDYFDLGSSVDFGNNASVFFVWRQDAVDAAVIHLNNNQLGSGSSQIDVRSTQVNLRIDGTNNFISGTTSMDNESLFTFIRPTSSTYSAWRNGASLGTDGSTATTNSSFRYLGSNSTAQLSGFYKELIIYASDQSANRAGIEANINGRYSIY